MKNRVLFSATALVALMFAGLSAHADTVQFAYDGVVLSCPDTGASPCGAQLFTGDSLTGTIDVDGNAAQPDASVGSGDILDFSFMLGSFITIDSGNSTVAGGTLNLDGAGNPQGGILDFNTDAIAGAPNALLQLNFGSALWTIQAMVGGTTVTIATGVGKLTVVPVPAALLMFGPALLAFFGLRRKNAA